MSRQPGDMRPRPPERPNGATPTGGPDRSWRWVLMALAAVVLVAFLVSNLMSATQAPSVAYSQFVTELEHGQVKTAQVNSNSGEIVFHDASGLEYQTQGPPRPPTCPKSASCRNI